MKSSLITVHPAIHPPPDLIDPKFRADYPTSPSHFPKQGPELLRPPSTSLYEEQDGEAKTTGVEQSALDIYQRDDAFLTRES
jgi:hypothetical protein